MMLQKFHQNRGDDVVSVCSVLDITLPRLGRELRRRQQIREVSGEFFNLGVIDFYGNF